MRAHERSRLLRDASSEADLLQAGAARPSRFFAARVRTQVSIVVNLVVAIAIVMFVAVDYRVAVTDRLRARVAALNHEATILLAGAQELQAHGSTAISEYLDRACSMSATESPSHFIEVQWGELVLHSDASHGNLPLQKRRGNVLTGSATAAELAVRITEARGPVLLHARRDTAARGGAILAAGILGALVLNTLLIRLVTRPLSEFVTVVRSIGHGALGTKVDLRTNAEVAELSEAISSMSMALAAQDVERRSQLKRARRLQFQLVEPMNRCRSSDIAIEYHPAEAIGGDIVDVIVYPNGDTLLCVADVVGHGIHAAIAAAILKTQLLSVHRLDASPSHIIQTVNQRFCATSLPEDFASMIIVRINASDSHLTYASAGHETCLVRRACGEVMPLGSTGLVLGVDTTAIYGDRIVELPGGDSIILVTDGVTEAMDDDGKTFGREMLMNLVRHSPKVSSEAIGRLICAAVAEHRQGAKQHDDVTVLVLNGRDATAEST